MRFEVADSDDEYDTAVHNEPAFVDVVGPSSATPSKLERDPVAETDFDTFLTPTQAISSFDPNHDSDEHLATSNLIASSTLRFLNDVAPPSSSVGSEINSTGNEAGTMGGKSGRKRSRTQTEYDKQIPHQQNVYCKPAKRIKGSSTSKSTMDSGEIIDLQALIAGSDKDVASNYAQDGFDTANGVDFPSLVSIDPRSDYTSPLDLSLSVTGRPNLNGGANGHGQHGGPHPAQSYTPYASFSATNRPGITTSRSSMGGYQSFSINPSELGIGYGDINPFGQLTQSAQDEDVDSADYKAIADHFRNEKPGVKGSVAIDETDANIQQMQTSSIEKVDLDSQADDLPQESPSYSQITDREEDVKQRRQERRKTNDKIEDATPVSTKKRGRKRKLRVEEDDLPLDEQDNIDELYTEGSHTKRNVRAGTVDSVSNASEISHSATNDQSAKRRNPKSFNMPPPEDLSKKLPSSDLGLDNKAVIGLSPERYVPRPSKRRTRGGIVTEAVATDDDSFSKSSKMADSAVTQTDDSVVDEPIAVEKRSKGKKSRKSKGKLKGKSFEAVLDEEQEIDQTIEKLAVKTEVENIEEEGAVESAPQAKNDDLPNDDDEEEEVKTKRRQTKVIIDIPALPKPEISQISPPPVPEPKKRGRKRKALVEAIVTNEEADDVEKRQPLSEKNPNVQIKGSNSVKTSATTVEDAIEDVENQTETDGKLSKSASTEPADLSAATPIAAKLATPSKEPNSSTPSWRNKGRIGLSKRYSIPSLLRKIDRNKEGPKIYERKEKLNKRQLEEKEQERIAKEEAEAEGREYVPTNIMRGADGMLVEWDF